MGGESGKDQREAGGEKKEVNIGGNANTISERAPQRVYDGSQPTSFPANGDTLRAVAAAARARGITPSASSSDLMVGQMRLPAMFGLRTYAPDRLNEAPSQVWPSKQIK